MHCTRDLLAPDLPTPGQAVREATSGRPEELREVAVRAALAHLEHTHAGLIDPQDAALGLAWLIESRIEAECPSAHVLAEAADYALRSYHCHHMTHLPRQGLTLVGYDELTPQDEEALTPGPPCPQDLVELGPGRYLRGVDHDRWVSAQPVTPEAGTYFPPPAGLR
ncbi:hypothetical protein [Bailinhaonella thermotolerans]|uniref:Uncharacterized protein n=1 Tax=Bailinhaonella thermotolerans TaxID=1070861 RepID=A0A3A4A1S0_9ACTN|nr:hypothetical protein [Bailinhaonella thermotolerans]RJL21104.1 hypothetical protein D5H75_38485 [Bailinhaonella thermotolerans]